MNNLHLGGAGRFERRGEIESGGSNFPLGVDRNALHRPSGEISRRSTSFSQASLNSRQRRALQEGETGRLSHTGQFQPEKGINRPLTIIEAKLKLETELMNAFEMSISEPQLTWDEILSKQGVNLDEFKRTEEMVEWGCVIWSLQSAFGVQATDAEWDMHLTNVKEQLNNLTILTSPTIEELETAISAEGERIDHFIEATRTHDSPLGKSLREYEFTKRMLSDQEVKNALSSNEKVLICTRELERDTIWLHILHIQQEGDKLISASDGNEEVDLYEGYYSTYLFNKLPSSK